VPRLSAGLLLYRFNNEAQIEILLVHPGGPFWAKKDDRVWSIPKGEYDAGEQPLEAAEREFEEELGQPAPAGTRIDLGALDQSSAKRVHAWAIEADFNAESITSNSFEMEWPPKSGTLVEFPEVDRATWFTLLEARGKLLPGQVGFLDRLGSALRPMVNRDPL
jgi:predicted NUDIX family NTP pyrophosphohydrolase